jgi:hypothetical protein
VGINPFVNWVNAIRDEHPVRFALDSEPVGTVDEMNHAENKRNLILLRFLAVVILPLH